MLTGRATHSMCGPLMSIAVSGAILPCYKEPAKVSSQPLFGWHRTRHIHHVEAPTCGLFLRAHQRDGTTDRSTEAQHQGSSMLSYQRTIKTILYKRTKDLRTYDLIFGHCYVTCDILNHRNLQLYLFIYMSSAELKYQTTHSMKDSHQYTTPQKTIYQKHEPLGQLALQ